MSDPIIRTHSLTRDFDGTRAVDALDLAVEPGALFGLVGPDGAGKTTTLRLLAGLLKVTEGTAAVAGYDLVAEPEAVKPRIGYMAQQFSMYGELSVLENLHFFAEIYEVPRAKLAQRTERLLEFAGLSRFTDRRAAHLSGGMQKKLALACTLIHRPRILLLDEPTTGVDPISRREFWRILTDLHAEGTTVVVSTPYMDEADRCAMVGLMYGGRLAVCAPPEQIRARIEGEMIEIIPEEGREARALLETLPGVHEVQTYGQSLHVLVDSAEQRQPEVTTALREREIGYRHVRRETPRMEQAFISLIRRMDEEE